MHAAAVVDVVDDVDGNNDEFDDDLWRVSAMRCRINFVDFVLSIAIVQIIMYN